MKDREILDLLIEKSGGVKQFSRAMKVSRQSVWEWREKLTDTARIRMFFYAEAAGIKLPKDFLKRALT